MKKYSTILIGCLSFLICLLSIETHYAIAEPFDLRFESHAISANLRQIPLSEILKKISLNRDFWYTGDSFSLNKEVTVYFQDLPLENALKRILAKTNYSLISNAGGYVIGAIILCQKASDRAMGSQSHPEPSGAFLDGVFLRESDEDEPQNSGNEAVIIDAFQVEMLTQIFLESDTNSDVVPPVLPGIPEAFAKQLSMFSR